MDNPNKLLVVAVTAIGALTLIAAACFGMAYIAYGGW